MVMTEVIDRWLAPDHRYFKVKASDGAIYLVRHDVGSGDWQLVLYDSAGRPADPSAARGAEPEARRH